MKKQTDKENLNYFFFQFFQDKKNMLEREENIWFVGKLELQSKITSILSFPYLIPASTSPSLNKRFFYKIIFKLFNFIGTVHFLDVRPND